MDPLSLSEIEAAAQIVYRAMVPTPHYQWPLLADAVGTKVWVKHENATPTGAFKVRGGLTLIDWLRQHHPNVRHLISATRGNHGQSLAFAARPAGIDVTVYVPEGNAATKNAAMRGFGAEVIITGEDFDASRLAAEAASKQMPVCFFVPSFHPALVRGVSTYAWEFLSALPDLEVVIVPIGCGSGICGTILARDALGHRAQVIGVVSENAATAKLSAEAGKPVATASAQTFADGIAVRDPVEEALAIYQAGTEDIVTVSDDDIADAIRLYFEATHTVSEGAGAAPLAALMRYKDRFEGRNVGIIHCGQNIDTRWFAAILNGHTPTV
ncbi:MAG: threonine dehydratase [Pseudomonadota bacterium]